MVSKKLKPKTVKIHPHLSKLPYVETDKRSSAFFCKWWREKRGLSLREAAELIGVHNSLIAQTEGGRKSLPLNLMKRIYSISTPEEKQFMLECVASEIETYLSF